MELYACVFLFTNSPNTKNMVNKTFQIIENINQILPTQNPLLSLKKYRLNPNTIENESICEINIILSNIHQAPCQRIMKNQYNSSRDNCQISQNSWSMSEVGAICTNPYIFIYFKQNIDQIKIEPIGVSLLNLFGLNPMKNERGNSSFNSHNWAFYNESCHEDSIDLSLKTILSIPNFYRRNDCLKNKSIANSELAHADIAIATIISILTVLNFFALFKIIKNIHKLWLIKNMSRTSTYVCMEDL